MSDRPRQHAVAIWQAAVDAVRSEPLVRQAVQHSGDQLHVGPVTTDANQLNRIEVVGAGKAGAGMAAGLLQGLASLPGRIPVSGWVNVPDDCVRDCGPVHLHGARPPGVNEPTQAGVDGTREILRRVSSLGRDDLCVVLISGGGSALLPCPAPGITLDDKLRVTRLLSAAGAPIEHLNKVRTALSGVKGGRLADACSAGRLVALILSDVVGDPIPVIASGPTCPPEPASGPSVQDLIKQYLRDSCPERVTRFLQQPSSDPPSIADGRVTNVLLAGNHTAVAAATAEATRRGFHVISLGSQNTGFAAEHGRRLQQTLHDASIPDGAIGVCVIAGGETTVRLAETDRPRRGGRNQEVVLAAVEGNQEPAAWMNSAVLSGGTDGEDGPTDAAGAVADAELVQRIREQDLNPSDFLSINDSYTFFDAAGGLLKTGPTHTNVMDVAVGVKLRSSGKVESHR